MLRQIQLVQAFRNWRERWEEQAAEAFSSRWRTTKSEACEKFAIRIRVCLQAYHKPLTIGPALAAELGRLFPKLHCKMNCSPRSERTSASNPLAQEFRLLRATDAAALIEFAVALPLLVVLVVGIFDFGGAFNLKQKLNNAVREGARFASTQPTNDLALPQPPSVNAVRVLVDSYLQTAGINDCGLSSATWATGGGLSWHFAASGNGCSMTLDVSRAVQVQDAVIGQPVVQMLCTTVNITYPHQWHFNSVIQLLVPGANYTFTDLHSDATAVNMD
jgi:Flp pilus assembly protein TadG